MLLPPTELSIAEAYLAGDVDVEGDLGAAVSIGDTINRRLRAPRMLFSLVRDLLALPRNDSHAADVRRARSKASVQPTGERHEPTRDRAAIHYHYDVGNEFYQLFLDERMVYSCAYFETPTTSLADAQRAKLDLVCRKLRLRPGERLLDVGCGWGALIMHAARHYGVEAVGITLSDQQRALATERIEQAGLADRCRVELRDYRDLAAARHVRQGGERRHGRTRGRRPSRRLLRVRMARARAGWTAFSTTASSARAAAHPLGWREKLERRLWRRDAFIDQYVFPDGKLGPFAAVVAAAEEAGFETRDVESLREHYALTLRQWIARLRANQSAAIAQVGERMYRVWLLYMTASARGFSRADLNVVQTLLAKPHEGRSSLPLTRRHLYAN